LTRYGALYQDLRFHYVPLKLKREAKESLLSGVEAYSMLFWPLAFLYLRLAISIFTVFFDDNIVLQISFAYITLNLLYLAYLIRGRPFENKWQHRVEIFNSLFVLLCSYYLFLFTDFVPDEKMRYDIGESFFYLVVTNVLINLSLALF